MSKDFGSHSRHPPPYMGTLRVAQQAQGRDHQSKPTLVQNLTGWNPSSCFWGDRISQYTLCTEEHEEATWDPAHPGLTTQTVQAVGASSDQPLNMPYPTAVSDWERACKPELDRPQVDAGNLRTAGTFPGTHRNDLFKHAGPKQLPRQPCRQGQIKPALRDDGIHYFDLDVQSLTASQGKCASTLDS